MLEARVVAQRRKKPAGGCVRLVGRGDLESEATCNEASSLVDAPVPVMPLLTHT